MEEDSIDFKSIYSSIKEHLNPTYRKQYNVRKFISCFILYFIIHTILMPTQNPYESYFFNFKSFMALTYSFTAWKFWHYSFWSYQGKIIDTFSRNLIHFGSLFSLIWKILVQNIIIVIWIAFIAPFSGIKTWRKAVKQKKILTVDNRKTDVWS